MTIIVTAVSAVGAARPGFFPPAELKAEKLGKAVFRLIPYRQRGAVYTTGGLFKLAALQPPFLKQLISEEAKACQDKQQRDCELRFELVESTAFFGFDAQSLFTARHAFKHRLESIPTPKSKKSAQAALKALYEERWDFRLYDAQGKKVYDTKVQPAAKIMHLLPKNFAEFVVEGLANLSPLIEAATDQVILQFSQPTAFPFLPPPPADLAPVAEKDELRAIGYPRKTTDRKKNNADGIRQLATAGQVLPVGKWFVEFFNFPLTRPGEDFIGKNLIGFDADVTPGMSGGPIFDKDDHWVGMVEMGNFVGDQGTELGPSGETHLVGIATEHMLFWVGKTSEFLAD